MQLPQALYTLILGLNIVAPGEGPASGKSRWDASADHWTSLTARSPWHRTSPPSQRAQIW